MKIKCKECNGRGYSYDIRDLDPVEGYKMADPISCKKCSGTGYGVSDCGSIKAFLRYKKILEDMGVAPMDHTKTNGDTTSLEHLLFMCNHCLDMIRDDGRGFPIDKYSRWLGYVQGCLICKGITTVEDERNMTRPWFNGESR